MRVKLSLFFKSRAAFSFLPARVRAVHSFIWLHILDSKDLTDITIDSYEGLTGFESKDHNLHSLWDWEESVFEQFLSSAESVLVAGAGGGREMIALSRKGLNVVGFDPSKNLVKACKENLVQANISAQILHVPAGQAPNRLGLYDALIIGRGVYHHIPNRKGRVKFLKDCKIHLKKGSYVLFGDFLIRDNRFTLTSFALNKNIEPGDAIGESFLHHFTAHEIFTELEDAGLELIELRPTPFPGGAKLAHAIARSIE